jgi:predicted transglutaminase-like cysteine proteinase
MLGQTRCRGTTNAEELNMLKLKNIALIGASAMAMTAASATIAQAQPWHEYGRGYARDYGHDNDRDNGRDYGRPRYEQRVDVRLTTANLDRLDGRVSQAARYGQISWNTANHLRQDLREVRPLAWRAETGRANGWEIRRLSDTINRVAAQTNRYAYNDRRGDNDRYGYGDRYGDNDHYGYRR